jgi:mersacidin/lichenicidin family type 2 lantibiotic
MSNREIVRAWKDPQFRTTLGDAMPEHPAGQIQFAYRGLDRNAGMEPLNISHLCTHGGTHAHCCG